MEHMRLGALFIHLNVIIQDLTSCHCLLEHPECQWWVCEEQEAEAAQGPINDDRLLALI